jgi:hypothetical protein
VAERTESSSAETSASVGRFPRALEQLNNLSRVTRGPETCHGRLRARNMWRVETCRSRCHKIGIARLRNLASSPGCSSCRALPHNGVHRRSAGRRGHATVTTAGLLANGRGGEPSDSASCIQSGQSAHSGTKRSKFGTRPHCPSPLGSIFINATERRRRLPLWCSRQIEAHNDLGTDWLKAAIDTIGPPVAPLSVRRQDCAGEFRRVDMCPGGYPQLDRRCDRRSTPAFQAAVAAAIGQKDSTPDPRLKFH